MTAVLEIPSSVAVTIAQPVSELAEVNGKDALAEPSPMVTDMGTTRLAFVDLTPTTLALGAGAVKVTLQVPACPATRDCGVQESCARAVDAGERAIVMEAELVPEVARTVAVCTPVRLAAVIGKAPEIAPAGIVTVAGVVRRLPAVDEMEIAAPPAAAALARVTVQVVLFCEVRVVLPHCNVVTPLGTETVIAKDWMDPLIAAMMVTLWLAVTAAAVAVKVAVVAPPGTVTVAGMVSADANVLTRVTTDPPAGAAFERVTVQTVDVDAARLVELHASEVTDIAPLIANGRPLLDPFRVAVRTGF
jgi:hypothetical protein